MRNKREENERDNVISRKNVNNILTKNKVTLQMKDGTKFTCRLNEIPETLRSLRLQVRMNILENYWTNSATFIQSNQRISEQMDLIYELQSSMERAGNALGEEISNELALIKRIKGENTAKGLRNEMPKLQPSADADVYGYLKELNKFDRSLGEWVEKHNINYLSDEYDISIDDYGTTLEQRFYQEKPMNQTAIPDTHLFALPNKSHVVTGSNYSFSSLFSRTQVGRLAATAATGVGLYSQANATDGQVDDNEFSIVSYHPQLLLALALSAAAIVFLLICLVRSICPKDEIQDFSYHKKT